MQYQDAHDRGVQQREVRESRLQDDGETCSALVLMFVAPVLALAALVVKGVV